MEKPVIPQIGPEEARERLENGAILVDVREQNEWDEARIPGAVLRPMSQINDWWQDLPADREIILQCRTGGRSAQVTAALMSQAGMDNVVNLAGGIVGWAEAGFDIET